MSGSDKLLSYLNDQQANRDGSLKKNTIPKPTTLRTQHPASFGGGGSIKKGGRFYQPKAAPIVRQPKKSGGGGFGGALHSVGGFFTGAAHDAAHYSDQAAHDIAAMPGGIVKVGQAVSHDSAKVGDIIDKKLHLHESGYAKRAGNSSWETPGLGKEMAKQSYESLRHPLRDPFQAILTASAIASAGAGVAARAGAAADAASAADEASIAGRAGAAAKAFSKKPVMPERFLKVEKNIATKRGTKEMRTEKVQLMHSHNPLLRSFQALHDRIVERALRKANGEHPSLLYKYGQGRIARATSETVRRSDRVRMTLPFELDKVKKFGNGLSKEEGHLALFLRSANVTPAEAADFWSEMVDHPETEHPALLHHLAETAFNLHQKGALGLQDGNVVVTKSAFPRLHEIDHLVREAQHNREVVIGQHDLLSPEAMHNRLSLVARTMGVDREGQGYTSLATSRKNITPYPRAGSKPVTGGLKNFIFKTKRATGKGVRQGYVPDNTAAGVAASLRDAYSYLRKYEHRRLVAKYGSDFRNTKHDVLVADPEFGKPKPIPSSTRQVLGQERSTLNTLADDHEIGLSQAIEAKIKDMIPHLDKAHEYGPDFQAAQDIGVRAPKGYKWLHENALGDLAKTVQPRGKLAKGVDKLNSAVTAATVYFKLSHIPQRTITDATTSAMSGALTSPGTWRMFYKVRDTMTPKELNELAQATGTHGYSALPHEDQGVMGRIATKGANFYSHNIDSHFRLLNLIHEARRAGINDTRGMKQLIRYAKNPLMKSKNSAKYEHILGRANRVSMMYDGLTAGERRTLARAFWFYPWTKAAARYAGHVAAEHPKVTAVGAALGKQGEQLQQHELGTLPSFEYGLVPFNHGKTTSQIGWLWPFNTASNVLEYGARPEQLAGNLNPVVGAAVTAAGGPNTYGESGQPHPIGQALSELAAPTPEARILHDFLNQKDIERKTRMFPHNPWETILQSFLVGPSYPKRTNKKALHFAAKKERGEFQDILVPRK